MKTPNTLAQGARLAFVIAALIWLEVAHAQLRVVPCEGPEATADGRMWIEGNKLRCIGDPAQARKPELIGCSGPVPAMPGDYEECTYTDGHTERRDIYIPMKSHVGTLQMDSRGEIGKPPQSQELREQLAIHAPPVPEWYVWKFIPSAEPEKRTEQNGFTWKRPTDDQRRRATSAWPWYYADMVLKARKP